MIDGARWGWAAETTDGAYGVMEVARDTQPNSSTGRAPRILTSFSQFLFLSVQYVT